MIHERQRLALRFEARDDIARVHAWLDDLQRNRALNRLVLLGQIYDAHASFTEHADDAIRPNLFRRLEGSRAAPAATRVSGDTPDRSRPIQQGVARHRSAS